MLNFVVSYTMPFIVFFPYIEEQKNFLDFSCEKTKNGGIFKRRVVEISPLDQTIVQR